MENNIINGYFNINNNKVKVQGFNNKYKYVCDVIDTQNNKSNLLPIFIMDYSYSMIGVNSKTATTSLKSSLKNILNDTNKAQIIFFGKNSHLVTVDKNNYDTMIDSVLLDYNDSVNEFRTKGKFSGDGTNPLSAFKLFLENNNVSDGNEYHIILLTDGEFSKLTDMTYSTGWNIIGEGIKQLNKHTKINIIGFKNDSIKNIQEMKVSFDKHNIDLTYNTLTKSEEISQTFHDIVNSMEVLQVPKMTINNHEFIEGQSIYTVDKIYDNLVDEHIPDMTNGLSKEWINDIIKLDIDIGFKINDICKKINLISNTPFDTHKDQYNELWKNVYEYYNIVQKKYIGLQQQYASLKTRSICYWTDLKTQMADITKLLNDVQLLNNSTLSEKKSFEKATNIKMSKKHMRQLERRKFKNTQNTNNNNNTNNNTNDNTNNDIVIEQKDDNVQLVCGSKNISIKSDLNTLNDTYTCFYSMSDWTDNINSVFCIPIAYKWKGGDDWNPSHAKIDNISISQYISLEAYHDLQNTYNNVVIPEHNDLYGKQNYVRSSDIQCNAVLPIATDPFFFVKSQSVKEQLAHMITGSSLTHRTSHILIYVAALKYCFNIYVQACTEKMENIIVLLINTFKLLASTNPFVFDKERNQFSMQDIIYNIAIGNTAPYLFSDPWITIMCMMTVNQQALNGALMEYRKIDGDCDMTKFKIQIWRMIFRFMMTFKEDESIQNIFTPKNFNLLSNTELLDKQKQGIDNIEQYMLTSDKIINKQSGYLNKQIDNIFNNKKQLLKTLINFTEVVNETVNIFNTSFIFNKMDVKDTPISEYFTDEIIKDIFYWGVLELGCYGNKNCYPIRCKDLICKEVINRVNTKYDRILQDIFNKSEEYKIFRQRMNESNNFPLTFTNKQMIDVNELFRKIQYDNLSCDDFEIGMYGTMGELFKKMCDEAKNNKLDVCLNLYNYVKNTGTPYKLVIKTNRLPYSAPSYVRSPYFLQKLNDEEFMAYFKPLGIYKDSRQLYKHWTHDLHNYMYANVRTCDKTKFVDNVCKYITQNSNVYNVDDIMKLQLEEYHNNFN